MRILYITPFNPLDTSCGGAVRSGALLSALRLHGADVKTIVVTGREVMKDGREEDFGIKFVDFNSFYKGCLPWSIFIAISVFGGRPIDTSYLSKAQADRRLGLEGFRYDIVVVRYLWCAAKLGLWRFAPCFVDVDDSPQGQFQTSLAQKTNVLLRFPKRWFYCSWQNMVARMAAGLWVSNDQDIKLLTRNNGNIEYLPNIAPSPRRDFLIKGDGHFIMTVGCLGFAPNYEGIDRFLSEEWLSIHEMDKTLNYKIVGRSLPEYYAKKWRKFPNVEILGFVENLAELYSVATAVVVPVWTGAGTSIKTIEAIKFGSKVIATEMGVRGLQDSDLVGAEVSVVRRAGDFCAFLKQWLSISNEDRLIHRELVLKFGMNLNTKEMFDLSVWKLLKSGEYH